METQKQGHGPFSPFKNHRHLTLGTRAKFLGETEALWALRDINQGFSFVSAASTGGGQIRGLS